MASSILDMDTTTKGNTMNATATFKISAAKSDPEYGDWAALEAHATIGDTYYSNSDEPRAIAAAIAAAFPKSLRLRACSLSSQDGYRPYINFHVRLSADGVNGGFNETGVKRYRSFRKQIEKLGHTAEWTMSYRNSLTEQDLEDLLAPTS